MRDGQRPAAGGIAAMSARLTHRRDRTPSRSRHGAACLALVVALWSILLAGGDLDAAAGSGSRPLAPISAAMQGSTREELTPLGEAVEAGPWRMMVLEVVTGQEATDRVTGANSLNDPPRDGFAYVLIRIRAENTGERPLRLDTGDFAITGASGQVRRFIGALPPDPAVDTVVKPGTTHEGWVVLGAPVDEAGLVLLYDSITLSGAWADRVFALDPDATLPSESRPLIAPNDAGTDPASPAGLNEPVVTGGWQVELLEVVQGDPVYDLYNGDFRVQALERGDASDAAPWLALRVQITNVQSGGRPAFLPPTAFMLVDSEGNPVPNTLTLTAANPDASGSYVPGASREGWVVFEVPTAYVESGVSLVRFLPYQSESDPRYFTY